MFKLLPRARELHNLSKDLISSSVRLLAASFAPRISENEPREYLFLSESLFAFFDIIKMFRRNKEVVEEQQNILNQTRTKKSILLFLGLVIGIHLATPLQLLSLLYLIPGFVQQ